MPTKTVNPTCRKNRCRNTFEIPFEDRTKVFYCPEHEFSGYWTGDAAPTSLRDRPNTTHVLFNGKKYQVVEVSFSGKRLRIKTGAKPKAIDVAEVEEFFTA